jgi:low affinity Fe/Cu permease
MCCASGAAETAFRWRVGDGTEFAFWRSMKLAWAATGSLFHYSDTWQLVINTSTTIITFLMVFLIQYTQNRDTATLRLKLDELIRATREARNDFIELEELDDKELRSLREEFHALRERVVEHRDLRRNKHHSRS